MYIFIYNDTYIIYIQTTYTVIHNNTTRNSNNNNSNNKSMDSPMVETHGIPLCEPEDSWKMDVHCPPII